MEENKSLVLSEWEKPEVLRKRIVKMLEIQKDVMKRGVDYDVIPGCKKPSLLKPGGELLMVTFRLSDRITFTKTLEDDGGISYEVITNIHTQGSDVYLGCGVGCASTNEEKYKWRKAVCPEEYNETDDHLKRTKWFKGDKWHDNQPYKVQQVRTNAADVANTVLKMAKKRSKLDGVMSTTAASRIYTQDIEDMAGDLQEMLKDEPTTDNPKTIITPTTEVKQAVTSKNKTERAMPSDEERKKGCLVSEKQGYFLIGQLKNNGVSEKDFLAFTKKKSVFFITWSERSKHNLKALLNVIKEQPEFFKQKKDVKKAPQQPVEVEEVHVVEKAKEMPVLDQETFLLGVEAMVKDSNFKDIGDAEFALQLTLGYEHFKDVKANAGEQQSVYAFLNTHIQPDQAGA